MDFSVFDDNGELQPVDRVQHHSGALYATGAFHATQCEVQISMHLPDIVRSGTLSICSPMLTNKSDSIYQAAASHQAIDYLFQAKDYLCHVQARSTLGKGP